MLARLDQEQRELFEAAMFALILLLTIARLVLGAQEDVIISLTSSAIVYVPFLCDAGDDCDGGW